MSSPSRTEVRRKPLLACLAVCMSLNACSDIYYDRRETVSLGAADHIDANRVAQMIDPWPRYVGDKNFAFDGQRMQVAVECYRENNVMPPASRTTSSLVQQQQQRQEAADCTARKRAATQLPAPAAPVR
ncbi:MAG: hypothetical protein ACJ8F3_07760 [Xanthobacteraceae bacterium]